MDVANGTGLDLQGWIRAGEKIKYEMVFLEDYTKNNNRSADLTMSKNKKG